MDAYLLSQDGEASKVDTFLAVMKPNCTDFSVRDTIITPADRSSSDDASPPGGIGSNVLMTRLLPGDYFLVATSYSSTNALPMWLEVVFTSANNRACTPICVSKFCGSNECGGVCNVQQCSAGESCKGGVCSVCSGVTAPSSSFNCTGEPSENAPLPFFNVSYLRNCGQDKDLCSESLQTCGQCPAGESCQLELGLCMKTPQCDSRVPVCDLSAKPTAGSFYCDSLCRWRELNEALPDIMPQTFEDVLAQEMLFHWKFFADNSCALKECIDGAGWRLIMRFETNTVNMGTAPFFQQDPFRRPDLLVWDPCHQHYHTDDFALYTLKNPDNGIVVAR